VGVFLIMTVAVSFKLLPMFTLSALQSERRCWWSLGLLNCGLAGAVAGVLLQTPWKLAFGLVLAAGLGLYGVELRAILQARQRRTLDWGIRMFLTALALLVPLSVLGLVLAWPGLPLTRFTGQLENVYGFLGLIGVLTFAIIGMLYKIVPFLVWYARYSSEIGLKKVPALADLYSSRLQACGYWLFLGGVVATGVATVSGHTWAVRSGCALLAVSLGLFAVNMGRIVSHLFKPKIEPLSMRTPGAHPAFSSTPP
jgi:hypothetical protein